MKTEEPAPLLSIRRLSVSLGAQLALDSVGFDVLPGTLHALAGPNGAGKTTLLRCVLGALSFEGEIVLRLGRAAAIGYVPQALALDPSLPMTVADFFTLASGKRPVYVRRRDAERRAIASALAETRADHLIDRRLSRLSGGELRRVLLAQALAGKPELLLLDEPASHVDEEGAHLIEALLLRLRGEGVTILMVAHDLAMLARAADRITALDGRVIYDGPAAGLDASLLARDPAAVAKVRA